MDKQNIAMNNQMPSRHRSARFSLRRTAAPQRDKRPFADNLEYLEALEKEALLMLVLAAGKKASGLSSDDLKRKIDPNLPVLNKPGKAHQSGGQ